MSGSEVEKIVKGFVETDVDSLKPIVELILHGSIYRWDKIRLLCYHVRSSSLRERIILFIQFVAVLRG